MYKRKRRSFSKSKKKTTLVKLQREVHKLAKQPELKWLDGLSSANVSSGSTLFSFPNPIQSATTQQSENTRIGDKITVKSIDVKFDIDAFVGLLFRLTIFVYKQSSQASIPNIGELYETGTAGWTVSFYPISPFRMDYKPQYQILYDKVYTFGQGFTGGVTTETKYIHVHKIMNHAIRYISGSVDGSHKLYMFISTDTSTSSPFNVYTRTIFLDS